MVLPYFLINISILFNCICRCKQSDGKIPLEQSSDVPKKMTLECSNAEGRGQRLSALGTVTEDSSTDVASTGVSRMLAW